MLDYFLELFKIDELILTKRKLIKKSRKNNIDSSFV